MGPLPASEKQQQHGHHPRHSFGRTLSLTSMPFGRFSTSSAPSTTTSAPNPPSTSSGHQPSSSWRPRSNTGSNHHRPTLSTNSTAPIHDPEAAHYLDPEARKKLRLVLSSAQSFDEAVRYGFPIPSSTSTSHHHQPHRNSTTTSSSSPPNKFQLPPIKTSPSQTFKKDMQRTLLQNSSQNSSTFDFFSFLDDDDDDDEDSNIEDEEDQAEHTDGDSVADLDSPITPSSTAGLSFRFHNHYNHHSRHKSSSDISSSIATQDPVFGNSAGRPTQMMNREMTLRMTLTRPDLRVSEDTTSANPGPWRVAPKPSYGSRDDPFALEEFGAGNDLMGMKGGVLGGKPKSGGGLVSRFFKRVKGRY